MNKTYDIKNPMAPPWFMYPYISRYSIGWWMGSGEDYIFNMNYSLGDLQKDFRSGKNLKYLFF